MILVPPILMLAVLPTRHQDRVLTLNFQLPFFMPPLTDALEQHFGFSEFRFGQEDAVQAVLNGRDAVVVMPTGSGKSLCYQLTAMLLPGVTLVISPLIALMKDQVDGLARKGLPATFINSSLSWPEIESRVSGMRSGAYKLVYVAPERFRNHGFVEALSRVEVSLIAVDEAHCVSQWGHDFRPDYLRIHEVTRRFSDSRVMALTATATGKVQADIERGLGLGDAGRNAPEVHVHGFARPNLHVNVTRVGSHKEKLNRVLNCMRTWGCGIIYCSTRKQVEKVIGKLAEEGIKVPMYHGGLTDAVREKMQNQFMSGAFDVVVATNAFGMGVDRADVRFVIHWDIPGSMEAYYQEIGRAGRDGEDAWCEMLYNYADVRTQEFFLEGANPSRTTILELYELLVRTCCRYPIARSMDDWADQLQTTRNPMAVRTAMAILERAGMIQRQPEAGTRHLAVLAVEPESTEPLARHIQLAEQKAERDRERLDQLLRYVNNALCRHVQILRYFGEKAEDQHCSKCDACVRTVDDGAEPLAEEDWVVVQKVLSTVARLNGRYGRARITEVLKGSKSQAVLQAGLDQHRCHGLLEEMRMDQIKQVIEALLKDGCLQVTGGEYPLLAITDRGREAAFRRVDLILKLPASPKQAVEREQNAAAPDLLRELKEWRSLKARQSRRKPYQVLHDKTLIAIAARKPDSEAALEKIPGIGPAKLKRYGDAILDMVDRYR